MTLFIPRMCSASATFGELSTVCRRWSVAVICFSSLFLFSGALTFSQSEPATAEQVIARYKEAIGASRFSSITTFAEHGELYGDLGPQDRDHGTFEFYFKSPNLRFSSHIDAKKHILALHGCDGKIAWHIDARLRHFEFKPKPGREYDCQQGLDLIPLAFGTSTYEHDLERRKKLKGGSRGKSR